MHVTHHAAVPRASEGDVHTLEPCDWYEPPFDELVPHKKVPPQLAIASGGRAQGRVRRSHTIS